MIGTWQLHELDFSSKNLQLVLETIDDVLKYLNCPLRIMNGYAFHAREGFDENEKDIKRNQYWTNSILVSSLVSYSNLEDDESIQKVFSSLIDTIKASLNEKLNAAGLNKTHKVLVSKDEDYGDVIVTFVSTEL